jgi:hypothetical protein
MSGGGETRAMAVMDRPATSERLNRVLATFRAAQDLQRAANLRQQGLPGDDIEAFWLAPRGRTERHMRMVAAEVDETFREFLSGGLVASATDCSLVAEARRHMFDGS